MGKRYLVRHIPGVGFGVYDTTDRSGRATDQYRWESQAQYIADRFNEIESDKEMTSNTDQAAIELAESVAVQHLAIACNNDYRIAQGNQPIYVFSQALFKAAIMLAYPDLDSDEIYNLWSACQESIAYCAHQVQMNNRAKLIEKQTCYQHGKYQCIDCMKAKLSGDI